jgi:hypothetical protein
MAERVLEQGWLDPYTLMIGKRNYTHTGVFFCNHPTRMGMEPENSFWIQKVSLDDLQKHSNYKLHTHLSPGTGPLADTDESRCSTS